MTRHDEIRASYRKLGNRADFYDGIITRSTLSGKLVDSVVWGLNRELAAKWVNDALSPVPEDFAGNLLEVPVGTEFFTLHPEEFCDRLEAFIPNRRNSAAGQA